MAPASETTEIILVLGQEHMREATALFREEGSGSGRTCGKGNTAACIGLAAIYVDISKAVTPWCFSCRPLMCRTPARPAGKHPPRAEIRCCRCDRDSRHLFPQARDGLRVHSVVRGAARLLEAEGLQGEAYVEKPSLEKAKQYVVRGDYLWNAGIFVATLKPS